MRVGRIVRPLIASGGVMSLLGLMARGALTLDTGIGRRCLPLGPIDVSVAAWPETVFDVIAAPYLHRTPRAMAGKLDVWEHGTDMVLAAHYTGTRWFTTTTVETVRFERPTRVSFRLLRGPVPHVVETFDLRRNDRGTDLEYRGELGTDFWTLGSWWGRAVASKWEQAVRESLESIRAEAERRARRG
jgi:hypothetical protein